MTGRAALPLGRVHPLAARSPAPLRHVPPVEVAGEQQVLAAGEGKLDRKAPGNVNGNSTRQPAPGVYAFPKTAGGTGPEETSRALSASWGQLNSAPKTIHVPVPKSCDGASSKATLPLR